MFRGSLEQTAQFAPREEIVNADLARDDGGGLSAPPYLFSACEAFWRISDQMTAKAGGDGGGELSCDADAEFEWLAELLRERRRICEAVASTPANSIEALTTKKEVVCEIAREEGASEMANSLIASFFADFDRLFDEGRLRQDRRHRALGENAAEGLIGEICDMFWDLIGSLDETVSEDVGPGEFCKTSGVGENDDLRLRELEKVLSRIVDNAAVSNEGLIKKRRVVEAWLQLDLALCEEPTLLNSFFSDFDQLVATFRPNMSEPFAKGAGRTPHVAEMNFLAVARR